MYETIPFYHLDNGKCKKCEKGTFGKGKALSTCINCEAGTYQDKEGMTSCKKCPKGQYQPKRGKVSFVLVEIFDLSQHD